MTYAYGGQKLHLLTNKVLQGINHSVQKKFAKAPPEYIEYQRKCAILEFAKKKGIQWNTYSDSHKPKELILAAATRYTVLNQPLAEQYEKGCGKSYTRR